MERPSLRTTVGLLAAAVSITGFAACGQETVNDEDNLVAGKQAFTAKCGSCHVLARAGTAGKTGPDLDAAFAQARADGFGDTTVKGVVEEWIGYPARGGLMPAKLAEGQEAKDIAAYVATVTGRKGKDTGLLAEAVEDEGSKKPIAAKGTTLEIPAVESGATKYVSSAATAGAGTLEVTSANPSPAPHNIAVSGPGADETGPVVNKGGVSKVSVTVKAGKYQYFCTVAGHREGGMEGTLTVK